MTHIPFMLFNIFKGSTVMRNDNRGTAQIGLDQWLGCDHFNLAIGNCIQLENGKVSYIKMTEFGKQ